MHSFIGCTWQMALTAVAGLNLLLLVYGSFTNLRTLTSTNNMFIFRVAAEIRQTLWIHTMKRGQSFKGYGQRLLPYRHFHSISRQSFTLVWPAFYNILLLTYVWIRVYNVPYVWIRVYNVPICFLVFLREKKKKKNYTVEWPTFISPYLSPCRIIPPRKGLRKME